MNLLCSSYGLKDDLRMWFKVIKSKFLAAGMKEMHSVPFVFQNERIIAICYVDDFSVFAMTNKEIDRPRTELKET